MIRIPYRNLLYLCTALLFIVVAIARIASTYPVFTQTYDEPAHIAAGMEWLDKGTYTFEPLHPPLARIAVAIGPYLHGIYPNEADYAAHDLWKTGNNLLASHSHYFYHLTLARLGMLPFFVFACVVIGAWSRQYFGNVAALGTLLFFTTLPPILAHSSIATTDMALAATLPLALYVFTLWLNQRQSYNIAIWLGISAALCVLSKLSSIIFLPLSLACIILTHDMVTRTTSRGFSLTIFGRLLVAVLAGFFVLWAGYRFSLTSPAELYKAPPEWMVPFKTWRIIPFPEFFSGLRSALLRNGLNELSRESYLFGPHPKSLWYFFPVAWFYKTPLSFIIAVATGIYFLVRKKAPWEQYVPLATALTVMLSAMLLSKINIGVRHVLPVYPMLSIVAGYGVYCLWQYRAGKAAAILLLGWQIVSSAIAHPHYLAYFNELAGKVPSSILIDSDLDWGQDAKLLADTLTARRITDQTRIYYFGTTDLHHFALENHGCAPFFPPVLPQGTKGWIAISLSCLKPFGQRQLSWLQAYTPVQQIGKSIWLYHIP